MHLRLIPAPVVPQRLSQGGYQAVSRLVIAVTACVVKNCIAQWFKPLYLFLKFLNKTCLSISLQQNE